MKNIPFSGQALIAALGLLFASCTPGGRSPSGFLANYRQLDAGYGTEDTLAIYVKPGVDLKKYDSVMIEPVTTIIATSGISPEVKDQLSAYLTEALQSQTLKGMKVVTAPSPGTIRVRTALTDVIEGSKSSKPITTVHSNPSAKLEGKLGSDHLADFISSVSFEGEILDSVTGERLCALSDHRIGTKREATAATSWTSVRTATNQGAARLWQRFATARGN